MKVPPVWILWLSFLLRGLFYSALLPLWEGWDEFSHFDYIQYVANNGSLPVPNRSRPSREVAESLSLGPVSWTVRELSPSYLPHDQYWQLPPAERAGRSAKLLAIPQEAQLREAPEQEPIYEAQQPPLYYWLLVPVLNLMNGFALPTRVFVLRCFSVLLASLSIPLGFAVARRTFSSGGTAVAAIAIAVSMPVFSIDIARVGNESLAVLIYTALLYLGLKLLDGSAGKWWGVIAGATLGAGLLTKAYFLTAVPALLFVCAFAAWKRCLPIRLAVRHALTALSITVSLSSWWYVHIRSATGSFSGQIQESAARGSSVSDRLRAVFEVNWAQAIDTVLISHVWFGAGSFLQVRSWMYHLFDLIFLAALIGLCLLLFRRGRMPVTIPMLLGFEITFLASLAYHVVITYLLIHQSMTNGWYLYCLIIAEVVLICAGLLAISPRRVQAWILPSVVALFAVLDLYGVHFLLAPYYTGLIRHTTDGRVPAFHLSQLASLGWPEISQRLWWNRGIPAWFGICLWILYLGATIATVWIAFQARSDVSASSRAPDGSTAPGNSISTQSPG